jgi:hypothetical protein
LALDVLEDLFMELNAQHNNLKSSRSKTKLNTPITATCCLSSNNRSCPEQFLQRKSQSMPSASIKTAVIYIGKKEQTYENDSFLK